MWKPHRQSQPQTGRGTIYSSLFTYFIGFVWSSFRRCSWFTWWTVTRVSQVWFLLGLCESLMVLGRTSHLQMHRCSWKTRACPVAVSRFLNDKRHIFSWTHSFFYTPRLRIQHVTDYCEWCNVTLFFDWLVTTVMIITLIDHVDNSVVSQKVHVCYFILH